MAILQLAPHLTVEELKERMDGETEVRFFRKWQILNAVAAHPNIKAQVVAQMLGTSIGIVRRTVQLYNQEGASFTEHLKWGGRREARCVMTFKQETEFLQQVEAEALRGEVLVAKHLRRRVEQQVGHSVSQDYLWDLLHRHGWSKKAPRPEHTRAQGVKPERETFKKKSTPSLPPDPV